MRKMYGELLAQELSDQIHEPVTSTTALTAIPKDDRIDKMAIFIAAASGVMAAVFLELSTATADSTTIFVPDDIAASAAYISDPLTAPGRWHMVGAGSLITAWKDPVRVATAAPLHAYTRTGNVLLADANGALNDVGIDGKTNLALNQRVGLKDGANGRDNGIYTLTALGGASAKWEMTRAPDANTSAEVKSGMAFEVEEGTANVGKVFVLTTANPITLNSTALTFALPSGIADLASQASGKGTAMIGSEDAAGRFSGTTAEAQLQDLGARISLFCADDTAVKAITPAARANHMLVVQGDTGLIWQFVAGSAAGADAWTKVPTDVSSNGGRWKRYAPSLADLAAAGGAALIHVNATNNDLETALAAVKATADAGIGVVHRTVTIAFGDWSLEIGGTKTKDYNFGAALPANATLFAVVKASDFTGFDDGGGGGTAGITVGTSAGGNEIGTTLNVQTGQSGFPKQVTAGANGFPTASLGTAQVQARFTSNHDLNLFTAGSVTLHLYYFVLA